MKLFRFLLPVFFLLVMQSCHVFDHFRKTEWTVEEVKSWSAQQQKTPSWYGVLLYQGSDSAKHYFISRVMDEWVWFHIPVSDLKIDDRRSYPASKDLGLGYYYVNPRDNFAVVQGPAVAK